MHDPLTMLKVLLLIPAAFVGVMTAILLETRPATTGQVAVLVGVLGTLHVGIGAALRWLWRRSADGRFLGHSARTWTVLLAVAYGLGFGLVALAGR
jgi:hypothetical protein